MITQLILDTNTNNGIARAGTPVRFLEFVPGFNGKLTAKEMVAIELPNGQQLEVDAGRVSSGIHSPEETLSMLSKLSGIKEGTLLRAAQDGRLMARKSGATWLSTLSAVEWAVSEGRIRG